MNPQDWGPLRLSADNALLVECVRGCSGMAIIEIGPRLQWALFAIVFAVLVLGWWRYSALRRRP